MPSTRQLHPPRIAIEPKFDNAEEWHHGLGDVPLSRIIFDPWPGTATEEDLLLFVERDKRLCELVDGTLVEKPVGFDESLIAATINSILRAFVKPRNLGRVSGADCTLRMRSSNRIRLPDVSFVSAERFAALPRPRPSVPVLAPELAVEVLSPSNTEKEIHQKMKEYFGSGTRLVWIVDPAVESVQVFTNPEAPDRTVERDQSIDGGEVLPGFTCLVSEFFEDVE